MKDIIYNIKAIRKDKGLSQEYMAVNLKIQQSKYSRLEAENTSLQFDMLLQIANVFDMSVIDVIGYPDKYVKVDESQENDALNRELLALKEVVSTQKETISSQKKVIDTQEIVINMLKKQ